MHKIVLLVGSYVAVMLISGFVGYKIHIRHDEEEAAKVIMNAVAQAQADTYKFFGEPLKTDNKKG